MTLTGHSHYYTVGRVAFESKIDAFTFSEKTGVPVQWIFGCDEVYGKHDWSVDPDQTLDFYYDQRARELREQYDYICLAYSGGADSHNVLMSFVRQGLHIDEIFTVHTTKLSENILDFSVKNTDPEYVEAEYKLNVVPKLKALISQIPKTKITSVDMSDRYTTISTTDESWVDDLNDFRNAYNLRYDWFAVPEFNKLLDGGKNICVLSGADKPKTFIADGKFYTAFSDMGYTGGTPFNYAKKHKYTNLSFEYFYWAPTTIEMVCKQAHAVKRQVESNPQIQHYWDASDTRKYRTAFRRLHEKLLVPWIYTTWDNGFQAHKSDGLFWFGNEYDDFWKKVVDKKQIDLYNQGIRHLETVAKHYVNYDDKGNAQGLAHFQKVYCLGELKRKF